MENLEKQIEKDGYLGKSKSSGLRPEFFPVSQRSQECKISEEAVKKELKEDSLAKASMMELLMDELVGKLSLPENYKIVDQSLGKEGESQELADKIWAYTEKLGSKKLIMESNTRDVLRNLNYSIWGFVERVKKKGLKDDYKKIIAHDFNLLKDYFNLLANYNDFEKVELGSERGFLANVMKKEDLQKIKNKTEYIGECKKILESKEEK